MLRDTRIDYVLNGEGMVELAWHPFRLNSTLLKKEIPQIERFVP